MLDWPEDKVVEDVVALRCCGAFHSLARRSEGHALAALYPPYPMPETDMLWQSVQTTIAAHDAFLTSFLDGPPQTNEVARSGILLGGFLTIARETSMPLAIFEIGASAGLNMLFDQYRYDLTDGLVWGNEEAPVIIPCAWSGQTPRLDTSMTIVSRRGCDMKPINPADPNHRARLLDYIWPDQVARLARIEAALAAVAASDVAVEAADAADWVVRTLPASGPPSQCRVLFHSIMWQYLPETTRSAILAHIQTCGSSATSIAPFAWLRLEAHDGEQSALRLTLWPGGQERIMARAGYHGSSAHWL